MNRDHEGPRKGFLYGSNDGFSTYTLLHQFDNIKLPDVSMGVTYTHEVNSVDYYDEYRLLVTETQASTYLNISELAFYGFPEYDPDADGTDVVIARSVPNVPNTDWLEVYWDGQDYASMPLTVMDKTGNGYSGTPTGDVGFDTEYKAFTFDGSGDYILGQPTSFGGEQTLTFSLWFNMLGPVSGSTNSIFQIGKQGTNEEGLGFRANSSNGSEEFRMYTWGGSNNIAGGTVLPNTWYHVVGIYLDGKMTLYVDGHVLVSSTGSSLNLPTDPYMALGVQLNSTGTEYGTSGFNGSIANFRLFNRAFTGDEVWQLYAYQKEYFGHGNLDMVLKSGRLGIGTSEPRVVLDVRGDILGGCPAYFSGHLTSNYNGTGIVPWDTIHIIKGCSFNTSTGRLTIEIKGKYRVYYTARQWGTDGVAIYLRTRINGTQLGTGYGAIYLSTTRDQASTTVILDLDVGDVVDIYSPSANGGIASNYNAFTVEYLSSI
jgi:hypothetical protein